MYTFAVQTTMGVVKVPVSDLAAAAQIAETNLREGLSFAVAIEKGK